jgi:c-di-GMP-binding flagellar brake protein YcgR
MLSRALSSWGRLLGLGRSAAAEEERRAHGRFSSGVETVCQPAGKEGEALTGRVANVSRGGIGLVLARAFEPGELLAVALPGGGAETSTVLACVVRCDPEEAGSWEVACSFATGLGDEDLLRFHNPIPDGIPTDRRDWVRFPCQACASFQVMRAGQPGPTQPATVLNISAGGVALQVAEPLGAGELLSVELRRGDGPVVLTTLASVVRVTAPQSGERVVGCNFINELSDADMSALL